MNSIQAKSISLIHLLRCIGFEPKKALKSDYWYISPFHEEKTASFKVDTNKNVWFDYSLGVGGNIIDFVIKYYSCDFKSALKNISMIVKNNGTEGVYMSSIIKTHLTQNQDNNNTKISEIKKTQNIENKLLIEYLKSRKIPIGTAKKHILEIYWINKKTNKSNFGIGIKNDSGGYEIRNQHIKLNIGGKDIKTIKGIKTDTVSIFEGFMDYLTALTYFNIDSFKGDVIILNSTSMIDKNSHKIGAYKRIYAFLDRDDTGIRALNKIYTINKNIMDCSIYYKGYKDFNEMFIDATH